MKFAFVLSACVALVFQPYYSSVRSQTPSSPLTGVYRVDIPASDKLYTVIAGSSSNIPFRDQPRFFIDLAVRLTPPDLLAIELKGREVSVGSSRAPRMMVIADGVRNTSRAADGHLVHTRVTLDPRGDDRLVFTTSGRTEDNFSVEFESIDNGQRLRVVRRISAKGVNQPIVIRTIYNRISDVARWELYGEPQVTTVAGVAGTAASAAPATGSVEKSSAVAAGDAGPSTAHTLRDALRDWIAATNKRDIRQQMSFYAPRLARYYLLSNASADFVQKDKARAFQSATGIDIRAEEPEIVFQNGDRTAVMRFRKKYEIESGRQSRRGEVIQELRWRREGNAWRIFSERDIRVLQ